MSKLRLIWSNLAGSFWLIPSLIFALAIALASVFVSLDNGEMRDWMKEWPHLFGAKAESARGMLSTIAGSMMTVVGVTFSMTLVTLALASNQFGSRLIRNFMRDRVMQVALGTFAGIFIYCLIVLRTIRGGDEAFVPSLAVTFGFVIAMAGIFVLIVFIHHVASGIQVSNVLAAVAGETMAAADRMMSAEGVREEDGGAREPPDAGLSGWHPIASMRTGYVQGVAIEGLVRCAEACDAVIRMEKGVGEFVTTHTTIAWISASGPPDEDLKANVRDAYSVNRFRTIDQDPSFGVRQIVDIALRALSPGINDPATAVMCLDYLSAVLAHVAGRPFPPARRCSGGRLRVIAITPTFEELLDDSLDEIRASARGNVKVLDALVVVVQTVAEQTFDAGRRQALREKLDCLDELSTGIESSLDRKRFLEHLRDVQRSISELNPQKQLS